MEIDFTQAIEFAKVSAKRCARTYQLDYDVCLSEAYLAISSRMGRFDPEKSKLKTYIYRIVTNSIIDYLRSEHLTLRGKNTQTMPESFDVGCTEHRSESDGDEAIRLALQFYADGSKTKTIKAKVRRALESNGWSQNRIEDAFDDVAESVDSLFATSN
jgi:RNA polymerase sigma factor (sigma-70 family)